MTVQAYDSGSRATAPWPTGPAMVRRNPPGAVLFKSTDGGESWSVINSDHTYGEKNVKVGQTTGSVFLTGDGNLYRSKDGGESFDEIITGNVHGWRRSTPSRNSLFLMKSDGIYILPMMAIPF